MSTFELLAAIDLRGGHVVRLRKGDFAQETAYSADPAAVARSFGEAGAAWIHVVDLDGARAGEPVQRAAVAGVVAAVGDRVAVEIAGGLRTAADVDTALATGAARAVVGTTALSDAAFARRIVKRHGADRVAVAIDVRDGFALGHGWRSGAPGFPVHEAIERLADAGIETFEVTAIDRDGLLEGPDLDLLARLVGARRRRIIASAGIASIDDLLAVRDLGCAGAIVGRALYEGRIDIAHAVARLHPPGA